MSHPHAPSHAKPHPDRKLDIVVADGEGDETKIEINANKDLATLLRKGLKALFGEPVPDPGDYDLLIGGTPVGDLSKSLSEAGLVDCSEVVIMPKDVSRG